MRTLSLSLLAAPALGVLALAACDPAPPTIDPLPPLEWNAEPRVTLDEPPLDGGPPPPAMVAEPEPHLDVEPFVEPEPDPVARSIGAPTPVDPLVAVEEEVASAAAGDQADPVLGETTVWTDDPSEVAAEDPALAGHVAALQEQMAALQDELGALREKQAADKQQADVDTLLTSIVAAETAAFVIAIASQSLAPAQFAPVRSTSPRSAAAMSQSRKSAR